MPQYGGYKYGSGSGIGGGIGTLNQPPGLSGIPKYSGSGIGGGIGQLNNFGSLGSGDNKF